jgi:tetratricopeptide (TPR) repeat protein
LPEAIRAAEQTCAAAADRLGPRHPTTLSALHNLGQIYLDADRVDDAMTVGKRAIEGRSAVHGADHPATLESMVALASAHARAGELSEAINLYEKARSGYAARLPPAHPDRIDALVKLGETYLGADEPVEAEAVLREALAAGDKARPNDPTTFETKSLLGDALAAQDKNEAAELHLIAGCEGLKRHRGTAGQKILAKAIGRLVDFYDHRGKSAEAEKWRAEGLAVGEPSRPR